MGLEVDKLEGERRVEGMLMAKQGKEALLDLTKKEESAHCCCFFLNPEPLFWL